MEYKSICKSVLAIIGILLICSVPLYGAVGESMNDETSRTGAVTRAIGVTVLVDFGDARYSWIEVELDNVNRTAFNATVDAATALKLDLKYTVDPNLGAFITKIGDVENAADWTKYWSLILWNSTSSSWEYSPLGASSYNLSDGETMGWYYTAWGDPMPVETPLNKYPVRSTVLLDFGNGEYTWADAVLTREAHSAFNATVQTTTELNYDLDYTMSEYGAFINKIGDVENAADWSKYWSFILWNSTSSSWESSPFGASSYNLSDGETMGWYYTAWGDPMPVETPLNKYPVRSTVLLDFGNGEYTWTDVVLTREVHSAFNATVGATTALKLDLKYTIDTNLGAFITKIGDVVNAADWTKYWSFILWNSTSSKWESSPFGASSYNLSDGETMGWFYTAWGEPMPVETPLRKYAMNIGVLIDYGNYDFVWTEVILTPDARSAFNATVKATDKLGLELEYTIDPTFGAMINQIGERETPEDFSQYWSLILWNSSTLEWEASTVGASTLNLSHFDVIGWYFTAFGDPMPLETPLDKNPARPVLNNDSVSYLGDGKYKFSVTVDYNGTNDFDVYVVVNETKHKMSPDSGSRGTKAKIYSTTVSALTTNFTYHFETSIGMANSSEVPTGAATKNRDNYQDKVDKGEIVTPEDKGDKEMDKEEKVTDEGQESYGMLYIGIGVAIVIIVVILVIMLFIRKKEQGNA